MSISFFYRFIKNIDKYIKYQIITKLLLAIIIIPIYGFITNYLTSSNGKYVFANGDVIKFLMTPSGLIFSMFLFIVIIIEVIVELGGFITISSNARAGNKELGYIDILKHNFKILPKMMNVGGIFIIIYLGLMTPITGFGMRLNFFKGLSVPNFVLEYIDQSTFYSIIYLVCFLLLLYLGIKFIFTFNFMINLNIKPLKAMEYSFRLTSKNKLKMIKALFLIFATTTIVSIVVIFLWFMLVNIMASYLSLDNVKDRIIIVFLLQIQTLGVIIVSFLSSPFRCYCITEVFYDILEKGDEKAVFYKSGDKTAQACVENIYPCIREKDKKSLIDRIFSHKKIIFLLITVFLLVYSMVISIFTSEIMGYNKNIYVFAHRGYGYSMPENSISAIKRSIDEHLDYIEIDVQRTKDGHYVLNHDKTFKRVSVNKPSYIDKKIPQLTLKQIEALNIGSRDKVEKVPTLEKVLDTCRNNIKINLELKEDVNKKMIDDILKMIEERNMEKQVIITSLDYRNLKYIEDNNPKFDTGLIYFIKLGGYKNYKVDYMIMEEGEVKKGDIQKLRNMGKKIIVWTVNSSDSIDKYSKLPIYGIISDYPREVKHQIKENSKMGMDRLIISEFENRLDNK